MKMPRIVPGHTLRFEGRAFVVNENGKNVFARGWHGRGLCSCGALGPMVTTVAARKRWHREHKAEVVGS